MEKKKYTNLELSRLYSDSIYNEEEIERTILCACFSCQKKFFSSEIRDWVVMDGHKKTAICPFCDSDTVIPDDGRGDITIEKLKALKDYYEEWIVNRRIHK